PTSWPQGNRPGAGSTRPQGPAADARAVLPSAAQWSGSGPPRSQACADDRKMARPQAGFQWAVLLREPEPPDFRWLLRLDGERRRAEAAGEGKYHDESDSMEPHGGVLLHTCTHRG